MNNIPEKFIDRLKAIVGEELFEEVLESFKPGQIRAYRINLLKIKVDDFKDKLNSKSIIFQTHPIADEALLIDITFNDQLQEFIEEGLLYQQSMSSMFISKVLLPNKEHTVCDACCAPGSKTSHMAALMENMGEIHAVEYIRKRFYKLKAVLELLGVKNVTPYIFDAKKFKLENVQYDRVLVDAPCSSEGRFRIGYKKSTLYWSVRKIKEMAKKQKGILLNSARNLRVGGELVYSTCTFAPEENEAVIDWFLRKTKGSMRIQEIPTEHVRTYETVRQWNNKEYNEEVKKAVRIFPSDHFDAFFMAKFKKVTDF